MRLARASIAGLAGLGLVAVLPVPALAAPDGPGVVINEIVYGDNLVPGTPDSIELYNAGDEVVDLTGWSLHDNKDQPGEGDLTGTIDPGEYKVFAEDVDFTFGLGKGDAVRLMNGTDEVDSYTYEVNATENWSRCPDGTGDFAQGTKQTLGQKNDCTPLPEPEPEPAPVARLVLNEIDSSPSDWIEFVNPGEQDLNISGYEIRDDSDDHRWQFPEGAVIEGGKYLVVDSTTEGLVYNDQTGELATGTFESAIGIGSSDMIRVYNPEGTMIDSAKWTAHAAIDGDEVAATISRCPDVTGKFQIGNATRGKPNTCPKPAVVINEVETNGDTTDWVEIMNIGDTDVDISGWYMYDDGGESRADAVTPVAEGTILKPGELFVFDQNTHFTFGLGKNDVASVYTEYGLLVAEQGTGKDHAAGSLSRCPDGTGEFEDVAVTTKGKPNSCGNPVVLNEIESKDAGEGPDWIELANPLTDEPLDISGLVIRDEEDDSEYVVADGTVIEAGGYLVIDDLGFGLGGSDSVRIFDGDKMVQDHSWTEHAGQTYGRCPDVTGDFANTRKPTPGARNSCDGIPDLLPSKATSEPVVVDKTQMFQGDSSGLDFADGFLWAVDNGTATFWKLVPQADGTVKFADGWEQGKRARFMKDADNPNAAGPDAEGITMAGDGHIYIASERDNSNKGVNYNVILQIDPNAAGPDVVASAEWDLTSLLPSVNANTGIEAIEWIPNADARGLLFDDSTGKAYDPADYPGAVADGVFVVALEDGGKVYAFVLTDEGPVLLTSYDSFIGGAMGLDYSRKTLRVAADNGYNGVTAEIFFDGTSSPRVVHYERPAGMPNLNNEGYAESDCVDGSAFAWFFADGEEPAALRVVSISCDEDEPGADEPAPSEPGASTDPDDTNGQDDDAKEPGDDQPATDKPTEKPATGKPNGSLAKTGIEVTGLAGLAGLLLLAGATAVRTKRANS
ncbi:MAG: lamin tail domain-containing protein [Actinomycetaceae bacterium]|nr:lamin tail domain-containing protein [Actinomycetaceae bacterium]